MRRFGRRPGLPRRPPPEPQDQRRVPLARYPQGTTVTEGRGPTRRNYPVFELPDVVLDLDAEDHPRVRPFDEESDGPSQEMKWGHDPAIPSLKEQVSKLREGMKKDHKAMRSARARSPFTSTQISDHDVFRIVLFGGSRVSAMLWLTSERPQPVRKCGSELWLALRKNGIPSPILQLSANTVIPFMLHRQQLAIAALNDLSPSEPPSHAEAFRAGLADSHDLYRVSKLCSRIDSPSSGVDISAESMDDVHSRLLHLLQAGYKRSSPEAILKFLNNVTIKRLASGKDLSRSLTLLGLQLASSQEVFPSILQYLQITISMGFMDESDEATSLTRLQAGRAILAALERGEGMARGTRQQILTLLTGRSSEVSEPQPSLLGLDADDRQQRPDIFDLRLRLLGELGAVRLAWHQSQGHSGDVITKALHRGAQVLNSANGDFLETYLTTATGDVGEDAALDLQTINALDAFHTNRGSSIPKPSLSSLEKHISAQEVKKAFDNPDLSQVMARFKEIIDRAQSKTAARKGPIAE